MIALDDAEWNGGGRHWQVLLSAQRGEILPGIEENPLWSIYGPLIEAAAADQPFVIGQIGQSIDGRIATASGQSRYINGPAAIVHLHRLRALVDAVVVGIGTVVADDPQLNVRHTQGRPPARVIIDPSGRLPPDARCLYGDGARRIVVCANEKSVAGGLEHLQVAPKNGRFAPADILEALQGIGLRRILLEGGAKTLSQFLDAGCLDRLHVMIAPMIIGSGPIGIDLAPINDLDEALRPNVAVTALPSGDQLWDCDLA
jgi:diaminohydroxyphosphoribosylaminopyrimidine deaminase / 5-amino-6-(5-phosphoribosylamino)uracil reductase